VQKFEPGVELVFLSLTPTLERAVETDPPVIYIRIDDDLELERDAVMSEAQLWESNVLRNLQLTSEARGLKFYVNPPRELVPKFLGDFRPDAIALGPEGGIIIEVKHRRSSASEKQLAAIAKKVSSQKGWEFRAIYLNPRADETPPIAMPSPDQLQAMFREIKALMKSRHPAAALVTAYAVLESLARLASSGDNGMLKAFSAAQAVQTLAEQGYIESETADNLREMAKLRNAVVHGDLSVTVPAQQVASLLRQLEAIASDIMSVASKQNA
jgi:uncharacterized protein YutE (UPF0331/DUF86 family)